MQEYIVLLSKKHGQLKQAITRMIQESMECLEKTPDMKTKLELIDTLRTVTDGKVAEQRLWLYWSFSTAIRLLEESPVDMDTVY